MKFFEKRAKKSIVKKDNTSKYLMMFGLSLIIILPGALMITTSIQASHLGSKLSEVSLDIAKLEQEVRDIESDVVEKSSLSEVSKNVDELGFLPPEELVYIGKSDAVAQSW